MAKADLMRAMQWEHPLRTLNVGTMKANVRETLGHDTKGSLASEVTQCLRETVRLAANVKQACLRLIGCIIERLFMSNDFIESDRDILDFICPHITVQTAKDEGDLQDQEQQGQDEDNGSDQIQFISMLMRFLYSGNAPRTARVGKVVNKFIQRAKQLGLLDTRDMGPDAYENAPYNGIALLRTVASQLSAECKRMYRDGSVELLNKLNELQTVRFHRLPTNRIPRQITSTIGGNDHYLTEVRNVVKARQDVDNIWGCELEDIKVLGIDLGQVCVVGACAILPKDIVKTEDTDVLSSTPSTPFSPTLSRISRNLRVKQKAVYQPTFKFRRRLEERKRRALAQEAPEDSTEPNSNLDSSSSMVIKMDSSVEAIQQINSNSLIESSLPPLRGKDSDYEKYMSERENVIVELDIFFNGNRVVARHGWDANRARESEYKIITDRLLSMVGGPIGWKRGSKNKVVIGIRLGQFEGKCRLTSLHGTFASYLLVLTHLYRRDR
ncbi:hypothetical protein BGX27_007769 [Mortierella sp. AM989]|nr:hypothetical protein BGX27_007769 [Mortierella sp. AM989]